MKLLVIIPARGGSKGLINKNILPFDNEPLIKYSIEEARKITCDKYVMVSTDSEQIAEIASHYKAAVPYMRPKELATDNSLIIDVVTNTVDRLKNVGLIFTHVMLLQPTSPLRRLCDIEACINLLITSGSSSVVSVTGLGLPVNTLYYFDKGKVKRMYTTSNGNRQATPEAFKVNGAIYLCEISAMLKAKSLITPDTTGYIMDNYYSIDIDDEDDFTEAEKRYRCMKEGSS